MQIWDKKMATVMMVAILVLSLCGCGKDENNDISNGNQMRSEDIPGMAFEGKNLEITGIEGEISFYCVKGDKIYVMTTASEGGSYKIYSCDLDGNNALCIASDITEDYVGEFSANDGGELLYLSVNKEEDKMLYELVKITPDGSEQSRCDIGEHLDIIKETKDIEEATDNYEEVEKTEEVVSDDDGVADEHTSNYEIDGLAGILLRQDGSAVLGSGENVYLYDTNLSNEKEIKVPSNVLIDMALINNGDIVCVTDEIDSTMVKVYSYILDMDSLNWSDALDIKVGESGIDDVVMDGDEYDFYYISRAGVNGYTVATGETEVLISQSKSYIDKEDLDGLQAGTDKTFIGISKDYENQYCNVNLVAWNEADPEADKDKKIITLGVSYIGDAPGEITRFNRNHSDCKIEVIDFSEMDYDRLLADIAAGKLPDIVSINCLPMSAKEAAVKGLIEELTPYYDKDEEYKIEDMLPEVYDAEMEAGGLYYVAPHFTLTSLMGKTEDVGDEKGWDVADLRDMMKKKGKKAQLFDESYSMDTLISNSISDYVDWDKGECHFDSEDFKFLLEQCYIQNAADEKLTDAEIMEKVDTRYSRFMDGDFLLMEENEVMLTTLQFQREALGVPINYIGYPNKSKEGSYFDFWEMYAISSRSENKELAWEFLRELLSKEYQIKQHEDNDSVMPVMKDSFDEHMKALTTSTPYVNEFGETIKPQEEYDFSWGDYSTKIGVPKQEDVDLYKDILHRTKHVKGYDSTVLGIVYEEAQDYFSGRKKIDKTIDAIQNRVTTYINEQRQ